MKCSHIFIITSVVLSSCVGPFQPTPVTPTDTLYCKNIIINQTPDTLFFRVSNNFKKIENDCNLEDFTIDTPTYSAPSTIVSDEFQELSFNLVNTISRSNVSENSVLFEKITSACDSVFIWAGIDSSPRFLLWHIDSTEMYSAQDQFGKTRIFYTAGDTIRDTLIITSITDTSIEYHFHH